MAAYHVIDTAGGQAFPEVQRGLRPLVQQLKMHRHPHRVIACLIYDVSTLGTRCTSYHTIYTPEGRAPLPGYAIYTRLIMTGVAHNKTVDGGLTSTKRIVDHKLNIMAILG